MCKPKSESGYQIHVLMDLKIPNQKKAGKQFFVRVHFYQD